MSHYSSLIDPAEFGLIADYLRNPATPIDFLVHVKSPDLLAPLAEALANERHRTDLPPWSFPEVVERGLADGSLRLSGRDLKGDSERLVDPRIVPRRALCHVIYAPPFYLVHTPGLFEGKLIRTKTEHTPSHQLQPKRGPRIKM